jgi:hypothetical protein
VIVNHIARMGSEHPSIGPELARDILVRVVETASRDRMNRDQTCKAFHSRTLCKKDCGLLRSYRNQLRSMAGPLIGHCQFERTSLWMGTGK